MYNETMRKHYDFSKARRAKDVPALARLQAEAAEPTTFGCWTISKSPAAASWSSAAS